MPDLLLPAESASWKRWPAFAYLLEAAVLLVAGAMRLLPGEEGGPHFSDVAAVWAALPVLWAAYRLVASSRWPSVGIAVGAVGTIVWLVFAAIVDAPCPCHEGHFIEAYGWVPLLNAGLLFLYAMARGIAGLAGCARRRH